MVQYFPVVTGSLTVNGDISVSGNVVVTGSMSGTSSLATNAINAFTASTADNFIVRQALTGSSALFTGAITAQTLVVQTVTSSILYTSGSNRFGSQITDRQTFTGSMYITGSIVSTSTIDGTIFNSTSNAFRFNGNNAISLVSLNAQNVVKINAAGYWGTQLVGANDKGILIDNTGQVGIGTTVPGYTLEVCAGSNRIVHLRGTGGTSTVTELGIQGPSMSCVSDSLNLGVGGSTFNNSVNNICCMGYVAAGNGLLGLNLRADSGYIAFTAGGIASTNERMRIACDGKVGIGTTNPTQLLVVTDNNTNGTSVNIINTSSGGYNWNIFSVGCSATLGPVGSLAFRDSNNGVTRMIVNSVGLVGVNCSIPRTYMHVVGVNCGQDINGNPDDRGIIHAQTVGSQSATVSVQNCFGVGQFMEWANLGMRIGQRILSGGSPGDIHMTAGQDSVKMIIYCSGNIGAPSGTNIYNASDYRLKKNIRSLSYGLTEIMQLKPKVFNWKDNFVKSENGKELLGFIAQDVLPVIPEVIEQFSDGSDIVFDCETITNPLRVNEKFIIPILTKAVQEQQCIICSQASIINTLKTCIGIA